MRENCEAKERGGRRNKPLSLRKDNTHFMGKEEQDQDQNQGYKILLNMVLRNRRCAG
jgi:hypothetical protein